MILVAGGTGRLGGLVANQLVEARQDVRVLSRGLKADPAALHSSIETVVGDVREPASLGPALEGVETVVSAVHGFAGLDGVTPATVDRDGNLNLVSAAERVGADVVLVSVLGASADSPMELFRMKYAAEQRLATSMAGWTVVRPEAFTETWLDLLDRTAGRSGRPVVLGRGDRPVRWVSVNDVAELVTYAVLHPSLRGRVLEICGPDAVSLCDLAALLMAHRGVPGRPRRVPRALLQVATPTLGRAVPRAGRRMRTALAMDEVPVLDDEATRREFTGLPRTPVAEVLAGLPRR